jgi:hypothetical protein
MSTTITWPLSVPPPTGAVGGGPSIAPATGREAPTLRARTGLPRRGLAIPVGVTKQGKSRTVTGEENDRKIIFTALGGNDNQNAFQQDPGLGNEMIFEINDEVIRARIRQRLVDVFADFDRQNRYRLAEETIEWSENEGEGELVLSFDYFNVESDEVQSFAQRFGEGRSAGGVTAGF